MSMIRYRGVSSTAPRYYGPAIDCDYEIRLEDDETNIPVNVDVIRGTVDFVPSSGTEIQDLRIRLEGYAITQLAASFDRRTIVTNEHRFLPDQTTNESYSLSLILFYFIQNWKPKKSEYRIVGNATLHSFPFELHLRNGICFPESFKTDFGKIYYKLAVYTYHDYMVAEKKVFIKGRLNLANHPANHEPLMVNWSRERSSGFLLPFRKRPFLKVTLVLNKRGFLEGDRLIFQVDVVNSSSEELVTKLSALVVQKFIYYAKNETKITSTVMDQKHLFCQNRLDTTVQWEGNFEIRRNFLVPTFTSMTKRKQQQQQPIKILYCVQIIIELNGKPGFKGEAPIVIGTTRDFSGGSAAGRPSDTGSVLMSAEPSSRRSSVCSDTTSILSHPNFPPTYSGLPSRRVSCETLPPTYEEAAFAGKNGGEGFEEEELGPDEEYWIRRNSSIV